MIQGKNLEKITVNGTEIKILTTVKDLGVLVDENLTLKSQINTVVKNCNHQIKNIYYIRKYLTISCLKMVVVSQVLSRLDFCNGIYTNLPKFLLKKLQVVLNKAARLVTGCSYEERVTPHLIELHWLPIKARILFKVCTLTHIALKTNKPTYLAEKLIPSRNRFFVPRVKTNYGKRTF